MNSSKNWRRPFQQRGKYYRLNYNITAPTLRVLDESGKQIGVFNRDEAMRRARSVGLDLVEIAPMAVPPVCKIIDFKKFRYLESKKERESKKNAKNVELKQIMLSPFIGEHDLLTKVNKAKEFLEQGHRLKLIVKFRGRQLGKKEFGFEIVNKFINYLGEAATVDRTPHLEGPLLVASLLPSKKKLKSDETENKQINNKTVPGNKDRKNDAKASKQPTSSQQQTKKSETETKTTGISS